MKAGKVGEHPLREDVLSAGLGLNVDQKGQRTATEPRQGDQVRLVTIPGGHVGKHLLVEELERVRIHVGGKFRTEHFQEVREERLQQFLEQPVMVHPFARGTGWGISGIDSGSMGDWHKASFGLMVAVLLVLVPWASPGPETSRVPGFADCNLAGSGEAVRRCLAGIGMGPGGTRNESVLQLGHSALAI
jgi:hypothetical protein